MIAGKIGSTPETLCGVKWLGYTGHLQQSEVMLETDFAALTIT